MPKKGEMEKLNKADAPAARHGTREASAVVQREAPLSEEAWRERLADADGLIEPAVEALLAEHTALRRRVEALSQYQQSLTTLIDRLKVGVALFQAGVVIASNKAADEALERCFSRDLSGTFNSEALDKAFDRVLEEPHVPFVIASDDGRLHALAMAGETEGSALLVLHDPANEIEGDAGVYQAHFGLTPTEAIVATYLVRGFAPRDIASTLGVGVETTRTHVKHILAKMGCNRQVDAVRRLAIGPALFL